MLHLSGSAACSRSTLRMRRPVWSKTYMSRLCLFLRLSPERWQQLQVWALAALGLLLSLGAVADVNVDAPRGPYDWQQRVIVLLPGVCAQPAALPPTPGLP